MTWQMWQAGIQGLLVFLYGYDAVELFFKIEQNGAEVGFGTLRLCCVSPQPTGQAPALTSRNFSDP
jgi:hypothetical protein